jgi:hypothetical protein
MVEDGVQKVLAGVTTPSEVIHAVYTSATLDRADAADEVEGEDVSAKAAGEVADE